VLIRVPAAIAGPGLAGYLAFTLWERRRAHPGWLRVGLAVALPALAVAAVHLAVNQAKWGSWIASPMLAQSPLLRGSLARGLHGLLLSPGASLFVYSPLLLLLPWTLPGFLRAQRAEGVALLAISLSFLLLAGSFHFWHGLWSAPGPRYLFVLTPLLMLPLGPWLDRVRHVGLRAAVAVLALAGGLVQLPLLATHWRRTVEAMGYQAEIQTVPFLFETLRSPVVGVWRSLLAGELDVYLWSLWRGAPGREPRPALALLGLCLWAVALAGAAVALRGALRRADADAG
jgi:hypothetical protein